MPMSIASSVAPFASSQPSVIFLANFGAGGASAFGASTGLTLRRPGLGIAEC
jgi:hypothetical protein